MSRDITIDIVRTIAIVIMIGANLASLLPSPHALWFRYYCSFAAPLFVTLAGMMVTYSALKGRENTSYFLKRGAFLILCGAFVDSVIFGNLPFVSMDVLYVIGLGLPFAFFAAGWSMRANILSVLVIAFLALALQKIFGYAPEPLTLILGEGVKISLALLFRILDMWFIDGWFPIFPWLGYLIFGVILAKVRWASSERVSFAQPKILGFRMFFSHLRGVAHARLSQHVFRARRLCRAILPSNIAIYQFVFWRNHSGLFYRGFAQYPSFFKVSHSLGASIAVCLY